jgi:hypothetical protein
LGRTITAPLLARFLAQGGIRANEIAMMLEPQDAQNVPAAIALIHSLRVIANMPDSMLPDLAQQKDRDSILVFAELFGAFVDAFTGFKLSLSEQMTCLARYALLAAWFYRQERERFLNSVLFTDSVACVKNAFFSLAKQQILDPEQNFYLFLLGTDGVEKLFAGARMAGSHNPNFGLFEFAQLLSSALDITRILDEYPEWYSGHRRLSTDRGEHADHLSPSAWKGHAKAGSVQLNMVWDAGGEQARQIIKRHSISSSPTTWKEFFKVPNCDIQRPCPGSSYPGVARDTDCVIPSSVDVVDEETLSGACSDPQVRATVVDPSFNPDGHSTFLHVDELPEASNDTEDVSNAPRPESTTALVDSIAKKRAHSLYIGGKWVHIATAVRLLFNTLPRPKQSKERLQRVRDYTPPSVAAHLQALFGSSFMVGHCIATLLRCGNSAHLAVVQVTHLVRAGQDVYSVLPSELSSAEARIELRGQVLAFKPENSNGQSLLSWKGDVARLRPLKKASKAKDILVISLPGILAIPVTIPEVLSDEQPLRSWDLSMAELTILASHLWGQVGSSHASKLASCSIGEGFPYRTSNGTRMDSLAQSNCS